jgi:hypothetical protein
MAKVISIKNRKYKNCREYYMFRSFIMIIKLGTDIKLQYVRFAWW